MALENELKKKNVTPQTLREEHRKVQKNPSPTICGVALFIYFPPQATDFSFYCLKESGKGEKKMTGRRRKTYSSCY